MKMFGLYISRQNDNWELERALERNVRIDAENKELKKDSLQWRTEEDEKIFAEQGAKIVRLEATIKTGKKQLCEVTGLLDAEKEHSNRLYKMLRGFRVSDIERW